MEMNRQHDPALKIIRAARMIDGQGGEPMTNQALVVRDGRIHDIKPLEDVSVVALNREAEVIDVESATLLPGLIDTHVHLTLNADKFSADKEPTDVPTESDESILLRAVGNAQAALGAGVTTVCDCGGQNHLVFALREAIKRGVVQGPRVLASGNVITTAGGHGGFSAREAKGSEEVRQAVAEQVEAGADFVKIMMTGGGGKNPGSSQYDLAELAAATAEARRLGKRVAVHCHGTTGIKDSVEAGVTRIEHCSFVKPDVPDFDPEFDSDIAEAIAQKGIYICPTNTVDYRQIQMLGDSDKVKQLAPRAQLNKTWRGLLRCGVQFIAGSDAGIPQVFCDDYALIMELMVGELGMSPMQAILAGSRVAAEALGMGDEIGTLEVGKRADIIAIHGDPLKDITALRQICLVMLGGNVVCHQVGGQSRSCMRTNLSEEGTVASSRN
jgi:imidazolonepropionase-like amidohydrolase